MKNIIYVILSLAFGGRITPRKAMWAARRAYRGYSYRRYY